MLIAAWVALLLAGILPSLSLPEILQCQGNWRRFRGRLYRVSSVPAASNREVAVVLGDVALLVEDFREELGEEEDCPLGQVALHLAQALPAGSPSLGDMGGTGTRASRAAGPGLPCIAGLRLEHSRTIWVACVSAALPAVPMFAKPL